MASKFLVQVAVLPANGIQINLLRAKLQRIFQFGVLNAIYSDFLLT